MARQEKSSPIAVTEIEPRKEFQPSVRFPSLDLVHTTFPSRAESNIGPGQGSIEMMRGTGLRRERFVTLEIWDGLAHP